MYVLLIDDHPLVRSALESVVRSLQAGVVVHTAATADQARHVLAEIPAPDLALLDLGLPDADGMNLLVEWRRDHPSMPVVVISASGDPEDMVRALDEGARGFIPKFTANEVLIQALRMVLAGGIYVPPMALHRTRGPVAQAGAAGTGSGLPPPHRVDDPAPGSGESGSSMPHAHDWTRPLQAALGQDAGFAGRRAPSGGGVSLPASSAVPRPAAGPSELALLRLTARQTEVLHGLLQGQPNKLIARQLNLSVETVKDHVASVLRVLGVSSRTQAVVAVGQLMAASNSGLAPGLAGVRPASSRVSAAEPAPRSTP